jgi:hypothetical protein
MNVDRQHGITSTLPTLYIRGLDVSIFKILILYGIVRCALHKVTGLKFHTNK